MARSIWTRSADCSTTSWTAAPRRWWWPVPPAKRTCSSTTSSSACWPLRSQHVAGRVPVIAGTGEAGTAKTVALTRRARELGADAALVVAPYYVRPTQEGLRRHFLEVAEHGGLPVHALQRARPHRLRPVAGDRGARCAIIRRSSASRRRVSDRAADFGAGGTCARRISSICPVTTAAPAQAMLAGAAGTISVVANLVPRAFRELCDAATGGRSARGRQRCHAALGPLVQALNCAPNPIAVKAGLPLLGLGLALPRLPLVELERRSGSRPIARSAVQSGILGDCGRLTVA